MTRRGQLAGTDEFDDFYRTTYPRLVGQLFAVTRDLHQAEDVVQEAFIRALVRWAHVRTYEAPELWVRRVAINLAVSELRRIRRRLAALLRPESHHMQAPVADDVQPIFDLLGQVPLNQRPILLLHDVLGLSVHEVAVQLNLPSATVRGRLARGRARLRRYLETDRVRSVAS